MTRKEEDSKAGRAAAKISGGLFKKGIIVGQHVDAASEAELGRRANSHRTNENTGWGRSRTVITTALKARRGRS